MKVILNGWEKNLTLNIKFCLPDESPGLKSLDLSRGEGFFNPPGNF